MTGKTLRSALSSTNGILCLIALMKLAAHLLTANGYGYFIDELYTIAMGRHPAFGYVDIPPIVPWLSGLSGAVLGYSLFAVHVLPALAGAVTVFMAGLVARRLGGGVFAQALSALFVALGPMWLVFNSFLAYDGFDQLVMVTFFYLMLGLLSQEKPPVKQWIAFGVVAGIGLMTKGSMLFYGFAFIVGLLLTPRRTYFTQAGLWISAAVALVFFSPYVLFAKTVYLAGPFAKSPRSPQ